MNNVFNLRRFGKYFLYDLKNGYNNFGINLLVLGMMPFLVYLICSTFRLIFEGSFNCDLGGVQNIVTVICYVTVMIAFPTRVYGRYTEKKTGANWITLPVSSLEKFLSLLLILIVVLPLVFSLLMALSNGILALIYGDPSKNLLPVLIDTVIKNNSFDTFYISKGTVFISNWVGSVLLFALGALVFKKTKVAKTFMFTFLIIMLFALVAGLFIDITDLDIDNISFRGFNVLLNIVTILEFLILTGGLYWRISTIKY